MIIGITGLMGSGKSTIGRHLLNAFGMRMDDCDNIAHDLYRNIDVVRKIEQMTTKVSNSKLPMMFFQSQTG